MAIDVPVFDPSVDDKGAKAWCREVHKLGQLFGWTDFEQIIRAATGLRGDAKEWFSSWQPDQKTWDRFENEISDLYPPKRNLSEKMRKASLYVSTSGAASYSEYARKKISLLKALNFKLTDSQILELVIGDITDASVKIAAFNAGLHSVPDLMNLLNNFTLSINDASLTDNKIKRKYPFENKHELRTCHNCGKPGHLSRNCFSNQGSSSAKVEFTKVNNKMICSFCGKIGHVAEECFSRIKRQKRKNISNINYFSVKLDRSFTTRFRIQDVWVDCLIDTGAECSLISDKVVSRLSCRLEPNFIVLRGIGGKLTPVLYKTRLNIEKNGTAFEIAFNVVDASVMIPDVILGRDLLNYGGVKIVTDHNGTRIFLAEPRQLSVQHISISRESIITPVEDTDLKKLLTLLDKFEHMITTGNAVNAITTAELEIKLKEDKIICRNPYRMALCEREQVKTIISDLLSNGIIRESRSPYACPIILVHKKDGSSRLCVDYRAVNRITIKDRFPLPRIDDQLDQLGGHKYFTILDMAAGFHQIPVAKDSIEKTAFVTPDGHYEYLRVPFGLSNAPAVFQRAICNALGCLKDKDALIYLDDILIPSKTISEGLSKLDRVLTALAKAGFSLNIKKCRFFQTQITYLGQDISEDGVRPGKTKVEALLNAPSPKNVKQVRQYLGLAGYFRKYIPNFVSRTSCISKLTRNSEPFLWGADQEAAKCYVSAFLSNRPLMAIFDPNLETELHTDASSVGFGAILFQRHDNKLKVVSYFSKRTTNDEAKYHSYELETLAAYYAIKHFRVFLLGIRFKLITDCNSLKLSQNKKELLPRVARWWLYLQSFDFDVEYRKGKYIAHVDYLSRNPISVATSTVTVSSITTQNWLKITQRNDPETNDIKNKLNEGRLTTDYFCQNDIVFRIIKSSPDRPLYRAFVPKGSRLGILRLFHDEQCHIGVEKTFAKMNRYFWFPRMARFVRKYCGNCLKCIVNKKHSGPKRGYLHPIDKTPIPFHTVHADCVGPFPASPEGYKHILLLIDAFMKFIFLVPLKTLSGPETSESLRRYLAIFGNTARLICDRGTNFTSQSVRELLSSLNIFHHLIAKSAPRANGQVERYVSTVLDLLRTEVNSSDWSSSVYKLQLTLNTTVQKSTGFTPLYLLTGKNAVNPDLQALTEEIIPTVNNYDELERDRNLAYERTTRHANDSKNLFDKSRAKNKEINLGDFVYHPSGNSHLSKLDPRYEGPFEVVSLLPHDRVEVKSLTTNRKTVVPTEMLRFWPGEFTG